MAKYKVEKRTYRGVFVEDLGIMTIDEIRILARKYIGDIFKDEKEIEEDLITIADGGWEVWLTDEIIDGKDIEVYIEVQNET